MGATDDEILSAHHAGKPPSRIAAELGVPPAEVHDAIVGSWAGGAAVPQVSAAEEMLRAHEGGLTWSEVGERFGTSGDVARSRALRWKRGRDRRDEGTA